MHTKFWSEYLKGRYHLEDAGIDRGIIIKWVLREMRWEDVDWINQNGIQWWILCEHDNEPSASIKGGKFLD
jgi:hypothetical protein